MGYHLGVGLISLSLIALQIGLTRIFSSMVWYHLSFLTISVAMLGFSMGGLILLFFPSIAATERVNTVPICATLFALSVALGTAYIHFSRPIQAFLVEVPGGILGGGTLWGTLGYFAILLGQFVLCFGFSGLAISTAITQKADDISRVYFANLVGSGVGCLAIIGALSFLGAFKAMLLIVALSALAPICFGGAGKTARVMVLANMALLGCSVLLLVFAQSSTIFARSILTRGDVSDERRIYREWNSFSVVDFYRPTGQQDTLQYEGLWGLSKRYRGKRPEPIKVIIDSWAITSINRVEKGTLESDIYGYLPSNIPYALRRLPRVLIMGAGGGIDVLSALHYDAERIRGVEINPSIVKAVKTRFADFAGNIYSHPNVSIVVGEGRHVLNRDRNRYDLIQLSGVDTLSGAQASSYSFSESYLYTAEAFDEYIKHLQPEGVLSFLRFAFDKPREMLRLMTTATEALERAGVADPSKHLVTIHSNRMVFANLTVKKSPFTVEELRRLEALVRRNGFRFLYHPYRRLGYEYEDFVNATNRDAFYDNYPYRIRPVSDDDPFFFNYTRLDSLTRAPKLGSYWLYWVGQTILHYGGALILAFALLFLGAPMLRARGRRQVIRGKYRFMGYFLCLGLAFMFVEILLMQRFTLFLGQPIYALSLVLFTLLVFAGLGSRTTRRVPVDSPRALLLVFSILLGALLITYVLTDWLFHSLLHAPILVRLLVSLALLAPPSFLMGFAFPLAVRLADRHAPQMVPWGWAINGYGGVLGSFASVIVAIFLGFKVVYGIALLLYAVAALLLAWLCRDLGLAPK